MWKECTKCNSIKPLWQFNRSKNCKFGVSSRCKICDNLAASLWMSNNKVRRAKYRKKYYRKNKEKEISKMKEWSANNRDRHNYIKAKHKKANRDKFTALEAKRRLSSIVNLSRIERFEVEVLYSISNNLGDDYQVDHILPISRGGLHHPNNLQVIMKSENLRKSNKINYNIKGFRVFWQKNELIVEEDNGQIC